MLLAHTLAAPLLPAVFVPCMSCRTQITGGMSPCESHLHLNQSSYVPRDVELGGYMGAVCVDKNI